jgi:4-amino-4-deoxy-L-arabinose transferase-like glycosyltransferase
MTGRPALAPLAIVAIAFALRLAWITYADFAPTLNDDAGRYDFIARSLADGGGFVNPNGATTMFWPPGYPLILAALYKAWPGALLGEHELTVALALNAALGAATVALAYAIGRRAFGAAAAMLGAAILALSPSMIFLAGVTLTETAFTFLLMLALWLIVEAEARGSVRLLALAGAVIGCAALVRGQAVLLPLAAIPFWLLSAGTTQLSLPYFREEGRWVRSALTRAALTLAVALAAITPWTVRNLIESGSAVPISSNDGVNFYIGHSPGADGRGRKVDELVFRYAELEQAEAEARISRDGYREGIEWAVKHPAREAELAARKLFFLYWRDDEGIRWNDGHGERAVFSARERDAWIWLSNAYYYAVLALAGLGLVATIISMRSRLVSRDALRDGLSRATILLLLSVIACWTLVHIAFFGDPRFHAPVMPAFALFAGAGIAALGRIASSRRALTD